MSSMGPRAGAVIRVKNPIKTRKYKFALNAIIDVVIHPGTVGFFWDKQTELRQWTVTFFEHPEITGDGYGVLEIPSLDDIEFIPADQYLPEWGPPPDSLKG